MGFLAPWFLIGAAAVALPLWLHLLRQFKRNPQPFSSLMFFERRIQSSVKHRRLRYLALLALRVALLLLLALAFANPFFYRSSKVPGRRTLTVVAIDRSFSMRAGNRLQLAKDQAHRIVDSLRGPMLTQIVAVDAHVESLTSPETRHSALAAAIDSIQPNDRASSFGELSRSLRYLEQTSGMELVVHFISDMQQTAMPADFHDLQAGPYVRLELHRVGLANRPNWAVENVIAPATVDGAAPPRVTATLAGWNTPATARRVSLLLDGKPLAARDVNVPPNGRASVDFDNFEIPYGWHRGEVRLEPADDLPQDNSYAFAIERSEARKALFLYARTRSGQGSLYYRTALESGTRGAISVQTAPADANDLRDFSRFAFVVLNDPGELDPALADALCSYVEKGGSVLIALGPNTARSGTIPLSKEQFSAQRQTQAAGYVDKAHPALAAAGQFENVQFSETAAFTAKANARVLARFADNSPLLVEEIAGQGRKLIFSSTLDDTTSDFALHASFVPFVVQTARYLAGMEDNPSSVSVGTPVALRHRSKVGTADVLGPDGKHELSLREAADALSYNLEQTGFYEVTRADGHHLLLAADTDRRESDLRTLPDETLELWSNTGNTSLRPDTPGRETEQRPWSLWRYILGAALLAALVESAFASRYLEEEKQTV